MSRNTLMHQLLDEQIATNKLVPNDSWYAFELYGTISDIKDILDPMPDDSNYRVIGYDNYISVLLIEHEYTNDETETRHEFYF